jgi:hypothetical protein
VSAPSVDSDDDDDDVASSRVTTAVGKVLPVKAKRLKAKSLHALGTLLGEHIAITRVVHMIKCPMSALCLKATSPTSFQDFLASTLFSVYSRSS